VDLFELGRSYLPSGDGLPAEERRVAILTYADEPPARWGNSEPPGLLHLKGQVETALGRLGVAASFEPADRAPFAKGLCVHVLGDGRIMGHLGTIAPEALESLGLKSGFAHAAEIVLEGLESLAAEPEFRPLSRFPAVTRDFSFLVDDAVKWGDILEKLRGLLVKDLVGIHLVGCYTGKEIPEGRRSWTFSLVLQARDRTLSEEDTAPIASLVAGAMQEAFGAVQR
jgi:phenylalanyl-tRNA synthetase beta chain